MPSTQNPFPGMNPFLQHDWPGVHSRLISYIGDALAAELPPDLSARPEERVTIIGEVGGKPRAPRVDVVAVEGWREGFPPVWQPDAPGSGAIAVDEPLIFVDEPEPERWVEIRDADGQLVTVLEVLSPTNKRGDGWADYRARQRDFLAARVGLVEIDLIRGGTHTVAIASHHLPPAEGTRGLVCVARPNVGIPRREVYLCPLRQRLPTIRVPLRASDPDVPLAIQPLIDRCYTMGRYWLSAYRHPLDPPLPPEDAAWAAERLRAAGWG